MVSKLNLKMMILSIFHILSFKRLHPKF